MTTNQEAQDPADGPNGGHSVRRIVGCRMKPEELAERRLRVIRTQWRVYCEKLAAKEAELQDARDQLNRIATEGFGLDDTISGENFADYILRQIKILKIR